MRQVVGILLAAVGGGFLLWAGASLLALGGKPILGYDPVYAGLAGAAVLAAGLAVRQE